VVGKPLKKRNQTSNSLTSSNSVVLSFVDIFAGCGGLSLGLMQAGWKGLFAVERDKFAFQTLHDNLISPDSRYRFAWPEWLPRSPMDISELLVRSRNQLLDLRGQLDLLVGGPPCQGFSSAGRRNPHDPRNKLVEAYLEFVDITRPRFVLIENVRGITIDFTDDTSPKGKTNYARLIVDALATTYDVDFRMIDLSKFGVPQSRHRFFVVGIRKDALCLTASQIFDQIERDRLAFLKGKGITALPVSSRSAISDLEVRRNNKIPSQDTVGFEDIRYEGPLTSYQKLMNKGHRGRVPDTRLARHRPDVEARFKKIIELCHADGRLNVSLSSELKASFGLKKQAIRVLDPDNPSPTVTSMPDDLLHYSEPRILTVRENARLQSFPDWFAFKGKYTTGGDLRRREVPRFTQVANAVPPIVAEAFGRSIASAISKTVRPVGSGQEPALQRHPDCREVQF
jgi:DNA (cytosine-5)-methyltransferase 1